MKAINQMGKNRNDESMTGEEMAKKKLEVRKVNAHIKKTFNEHRLVVCFPAPLSHQINVSEKMCTVMPTFCRVIVLYTLIDGKTRQTAIQIN